MTKRMLIDAAHTDETRVVILDNDRVQDYDFVTSSKTQIKGNIYLAKITRVEPSLQAAFVEYGGGKQGFLPFSEIHPDYYQLPQEDKQKLLEEQIAEAEAEAEAEEQAFEREQAARESRRGNRHDEDEDTFDMNDDPTLGSISEDASSSQADHISLESSNVQTNEEISATAAEPMIPVEALALPAQADDILQDIPGHVSIVSLEAPSFSTQSDIVDGLPEQNISNVVPHHDAFEAQNASPEDNLEGSSTTSEDAEETRNAIDRNARGFHRRYRIQEVIKRNQIVLVQVIKEERGNKGCSLTTYISLAGRCAVLMPNSPKGGGISRKITDRETRRRLKEVASEMRTHRGMSVIIRTAGIDRTRAEIRRDYEYLVKLWNDVRAQTLKSTAPALIYEEGNLIKRSLRDAYSADIEEVIVEGESGYEEARNFMRMLMPAQAGRVKLYKDTMPLFSYAGVEDQLSGMTEPQVKLPSGGYLVINPTEALISIDVNSGRSTTERNVEETALKTNLEAAAEVGRQMRLRDLAGLVVIDFIDMNYGKNRKAVERAMKDAVRSDRAKITLGRISMFGLMELSRQRMRPSISESMGITCPHCKGTGHVHSVETIGIQIIRTLEKEASTGEYATLRVTANPDASLHLLNDKREMLQTIEQRYGVSVEVLMDTSLITGQFSLIKITKEGKEIAHDHAQAARRQPNRGRRSRRGGGEHGRALDFSDVVETSPDDLSIDDFLSNDDEDNEILIPSQPANASESGSTEPRARRDRGERGGRRRGGRNRNRNRDRDPNREPNQPEPVAAAQELGTEGESIAVDAALDLDAEGKRQREERKNRNRRRGRRGGRNRHDRGERPAQDAQAGSQVSQESANQASPAAAPIYHSETRVERALPPAAPDIAPTRPAPAAYEPTRVIPLTEAQTNPLAVASTIRSESTGNADNATKRKGWWARVLES